MKRFAVFFLSAAIIIILSGCLSTEKPVRPKRDFTRPHAGQERWVLPEEVYPTLQEFVERYKMASQRQQVTRELAVYLRMNYGRVSINGTDSDGGRRALDFIGEMMESLKASERSLWFDAVELAKTPDPRTIGLGSAPIPRDYSPRWY